MDLLPGGVDDQAGDGIAKFRGGTGSVSECREVSFLNEYDVSAVNVLLKKIVSGFSGFMNVLAEKG